MLRVLCILCGFLFFSGPLRAQDAAPAPAAAAAAAEVSAASAEDTASAGALPRNFREINLGMGLDELKTALTDDVLFNFRGDRDVSFLPAQEQSLVEITGFSFVKRAFFQLREGSVFIMAFTLNSGLVDHYSVFTSLVEKYGQPNFLNPEQAVWETETTRLALERPLTVKYIDMTVFNGIIGESAAAESAEILRRQEFLDGF
ncbi:hypothetical protein AGMMS49587_08360 [Spirochaetia bacterium]|nr:hypothetical protein AGMMS49587_08360 [Spirochaetia bacterium]